jgi:hypothetical protein
MKVSEDEFGGEKEKRDVLSRVMRDEHARLYLCLAQRVLRGLPRVVAARRARADEI